MKCLLLGLDPYSATDPLGMLPLFLKITADVLPPRLIVVFRWLLRLYSFLACRGNCIVSLLAQFAYQKGLATNDALLCVSHTLQNALESGQEARIVQIDFSAAFDKVNHQLIL